MNDLGISAIQRGGKITGRTLPWTRKRVVAFYNGCRGIPFHISLQISPSKSLTAKVISSPYHVSPLAEVNLVNSHWPGPRDQTNGEKGPWPEAGSHSSIQRQRSIRYAVPWFNVFPGPLGVWSRTRDVFTLYIHTVDTITRSWRERVFYIFR